MVWQDFVIGGATILLSLALIPQVISGFKKREGVILVPVGALTAIGLFVLTFTFFTLGFFFAMLMNLITGVLWVLLLFQTLVFGRSRKT